jgi:DNA-binding NarL/FixJ family response regulator
MRCHRNEQTLRTEGSEDKDTGPDCLSPREKQVLVLIADDLSTNQIADRLGVNFKTVYSYRSRIVQKLGIHSAIGLVRYAIRQKMIKP